jgi:uncharacterized protein YkwD
MAAAGLLVFALMLPTQANQLAQSVLGETVSVAHTNSISTSSKKVSAILDSTISSVLSKPRTTAKSTVTPNAVIDTSPLSVENIIDATNQERIKAGLQPLKTSTKLEQSEKIKTEDMITNHYFEHTSPNGKTVADLGNEVGYNYVVMGENLAVGDFTDAHDLLTAWMNSPGHRANILNTSYEDIGVYAAQGTYQGRTVWFAVQHFGTERGVCPIISSSLKNSIDALNTSITAQEAAITALRTKIEDPNHTDDQAYKDMITQFNALVAKYNADLITSQTKIAAYNKQVVAFNNCLSQYQVSTPKE